MSAERDPYLDPDDLVDPDDLSDPDPGPAPRSAPSWWTRPLTVASVAAVVVGTVLGAWISSWRPEAAPAATAPKLTLPTVTSTPVDADAVARLTARAKADPKDASVRLELARAYAAGLEWDDASKWQGRYVALRPSENDARLIQGVYAYNGQDLAGAEQAFREVLRRDPKSQEALYDLGFVALAQHSTDQSEATRLWRQAVDLDPSTETARRASHQLDALGAGSAAVPSPQQS